MKIPNARIIKEFKTVIVPGVFNATYNSLIKKDFENVIKISTLFSKYIIGLEQEKYINSKQAQELDLLWVKELEQLQG